MRPIGIVILVFEFIFWILFCIIGLTSMEMQIEESSLSIKGTTSSVGMALEQGVNQISDSSEEEEKERIKIGRCRLTIYTPYESHWGYTTATGIKSEHLKTCAVDPELIPYGSTVILKVPGSEEEWKLIAVDCGAFTGKLVDVFYDGTVADGVDLLVETFGEEYAEVWIERGDLDEYKSED